MKILVTGSTGIIGQQLIKDLRIEYPEAEISGTFYQIRSTNFENQLLDDNANNIKYFHYSEIFKLNIKFDQIWHFATYGQPAKFIGSWNEVIKLNTDDVLYLSKLLSPNGKFLYASSSELYGPQGSSNEDDAPASLTCTPRSIYIDSKRLGESILYSRLDIANFRIFRICLAYSSFFKKDDRRVLYELILKAINNKEINLMDDGSALRQYLYVEDASKMMINLANLNYSNLMINNSVPIFNIANPKEPITIFELANLIAENFNVPVKKGPAKLNVYSAPKIVKVYPKRFLKIFKDFEFTKLRVGLKIVCNSAKRNYSA